MTEEGKTQFIRQDDSTFTFHFVCEGCGASGELELEKADGMKPLGCPEGCGATYVPWQPPSFENLAPPWVLKCVVLPVFNLEEGGDEYIP